MIVREENLKKYSTGVRVWFVKPTVWCLHPLRLDTVENGTELVRKVLIL